jgi:hypothetical protein
MARLIVLDRGQLDLIVRAPSKPQVVRCFSSRLKPLLPTKLLLNFCAAPRTPMKCQRGRPFS